MIFLLDSAGGPCQVDGVVVIKKYANRRLYDTSDSRYITLEELRDKVRGGQDVEVRDANTGEDLTSITLAQIVMEGRGGAKLLPVSLLVQLIRMGDDAFTEFFGRFLTFSLEMYLDVRTRTDALLPPFMMTPWSALGALQKWWPGRAEEAKRARTSRDESAEADEAEGGDTESVKREISTLRKELSSLRRALEKKPRG